VPFFVSERLDVLPITTANIFCQLLIVAMLQNLKRFLAERHNVRAHFWQSLANYTQSGGGMLLGILLARLLEPSVFGEFVLVTATLAFLMIPVSFSTAQLLISDAGRTSGLLSRVLGLATLVCVVKMLLLLGYVGFNLWQGDLVRAGVAAIAGAPLVFADYITALRCDLEGRGLFKQNFLVQILDLVAHASVAITLVLLGYGIYGLALGGVAGFVPHMILYVYLAGCRSMKVTWSRDQLTFQFRKGFWLWLASVASNWYSRVDKVFLGILGSTTQLGYYNRAMNYGPISHILLNSLMTNATIRGLTLKQDLADRRSLFLKTMSVILSAAALNGVFWYFAADTLVPLVFGQQWGGATPAFVILGWLGIPYCLVYGSATVLYACQEFKTIAAVHLAGLAALIATVLIVANTGGLSSVNTAISFVGTMLLTGLVMMIAALRLLFPATHETT
jgi:O-antigen/teichoic acid export membrane protein